MSAKQNGRNKIGKSNENSKPVKRDKERDRDKDRDKDRDRIRERGKNRATTRGDRDRTPRKENSPRDLSKLIRFFPSKFISFLKIFTQYRIN